MAEATLLALLVAALAYANGSNDVFKGVATLHGSGELSYRAALRLATAATLAGGALSLVLAGALAERFSGNGLLPEEALGSLAALGSVAGAAAATVLLASRLGLPTSTTHALTGGLAGVALSAGAGASALAPLAGLFLAPLLLGPLVAALLSWSAALLAPRGVGPSDGELCVCVEDAPPPRPRGGALAVAAHAVPALVVASRRACARVLAPEAVVATGGSLSRGLHVLSAGTVCFARAVNDTPKIAALLLAAPAAGAAGPVGIATLAMALGGWLGARRVAETMSHGITSIERSQGLLGNAVTALLVLGASPLGLPLSTTHVSCGAIFGLGLARRRVERSKVARVLLAWVATLPLAAGLAAAFHALAA